MLRRFVTLLSFTFELQRENYKFPSRPTLKVTPGHSRRLLALLTMLNCFTLRVNEKTWLKNGIKGSYLTPPRLPRIE